MADFDKYVDVKQKFANQLLEPKILSGSDPKLHWLARNVIGVGVGLKMKKYELTEKPCLTLLVRSKLPKEALGPFELTQRAKRLGMDLPDEEMDVVEMEQTRCLGGFEGPVNVLGVGSDVAIAGRSTHGTVCGFVSYAGSKSLHLLTCSHVIASHGGAFSLVVSRDSVVGRISKEAPLLPGHGSHSGPKRNHSQQDAATAELISGVEPNFDLPGLRSRLTDSTPASPQPGDHVIKTGRNVRHAMVLCTNLKIALNYPGQVSYLDHQMLVSGPVSENSPFAKPGDSGSMVVARAGGKTRAVGMVIGAGDPANLARQKGESPSMYAIVSPMERVLEALGAKLVVN
jgi:hypothetical protein